MLTRHEGKKYSVYQDSEGYWTLGIGHLVDARKGGKLSERMVNFIFAEDVAEKTDQVKKNLPWAQALSNTRFNVLIDLCFNLGITGLLKFGKMLHALETRDYKTAAAELLDSKAARQLPARYTELANLLIAG